MQKSNEKLDRGVKRVEEKDRVKHDVKEAQK